MGSSGGHRRLPGGSDHFSLQTDTQTLHHNIYIIIKQIESGHLSVVELVAHDTVALRVKSCNSRRVIRDFLVKRSVHLFVLSARLGTTLQERPTQGTVRELPSP